VRDFRVP